MEFGAQSFCLPIYHGVFAISAILEELAGLSAAAQAASAAARFDRVEGWEAVGFLLLPQLLPGDPLCAVIFFCLEKNLGLNPAGNSRAPISLARGGGVRFLSAGGEVCSRRDPVWAPDHEFPCALRRKKML